MKYVPILQELFESDTVVFLLLGLAGTLIVELGGLALKKRQEQKKLLRALVASLTVYAACEAGANLHTNYRTEMILLFLGTAALGCALGFLIMLGIMLFERAKK